MQVGPARRKVTHPWRLRVKRRGPLPLGFSQVLILNLVKVLYFDTLLQVLILKIVNGVVLNYFYKCVIQKT